MNLLTINGMKKSYTDKLLFDNADFSIGEGDKVGIIGVNGTGKTTLLKIVAGIDHVDDGAVTKANKVKINYLPQNPIIDKGMTVFEYVISEQEDVINHSELEGNAKSMLNTLGFPDFNVKTDFISGGQKKRLALVKILLSHCDILILDEPTNHMDNEMTQWLEEFLFKLKSSLIMVTHDRYFLDKVVNRIVEIDEGKIYNYKGRYEDFLEQKTLREEIEIASERKRQSILKVELEWIRRGARARSTKQKAHIQRYENLRDAKGLTVKENIEMSSISSRLGKKTIELNSISKYYDETCYIKDFTYIFLNGERIGIVGKNGCGKSTLLKIICGKIKADAGSIDIGSTVKIGYFTQENENLPENERVIDYIKETAEYIKTKTETITASQMLKRFLFNDTLQYQKIEKLSGGEKRRLYLLKILMDSPNVLILDEPTNDLDIQTMTIFEDYLDSFDGIVITVSHDRYFLNRITERIFAFEEDGEIKQYEGNYDDYLLKAPTKDSSIIKQKKSPVEKTANEKPTGDKLKMSFNEKYEFERIDDEILELEERLEYIENEIASCTSDFIKLTKLMNEKDEKSKILEEKMDRWVYLNDLDEKIKNQ